METKAHNVWVGAVTLLLLAVVAGFVIWLARLNEGSQNEYDIFFKQSVDGLSKGSEVSFAGVPIGQIQKIELWPKDPSFVRVRIKVDSEVPILLGTTATIQGSFTGVSNVQLAGAVKGAPPIAEPGPEGVPVIPTRRGGLGELLNGAPVLLERLATLTENLNSILNEDNKKAISGILKNSERLTDSLADASPQVQATLAELQVTLKQATATLESVDKVALSANHQLSGDQDSLIRDLRVTLRSAKDAADQLGAVLGDSRPTLTRLNDTTLPAAEAAIRELRATSRALRNVTEKIDEQGAGAVLGGNNLPDYKP